MVSSTIRARRAQPGHDQVAALEVALVALVAERARAGVPAEVVELVAGGGQLGPAHHLAVRSLRQVAVDDGHGVSLPPRGVVRGHVGEGLRGAAIAALGVR